uniref:ADAM metallopeptidase domain 15 n=1 Tax=Anas platyrhynchos TaxID=8839 RepID=A0A8B9SYQ8_ANAPL
MVLDHAAVSAGRVGARCRGLPPPLLMPFPAPAVPELPRPEPCPHPDPGNRQPGGHGESSRAPATPVCVSLCHPLAAMGVPDPPPPCPPVLPAAGRARGLGGGGGVERGRQVRGGAQCPGHAGAVPAVAPGGAAAPAAPRQRAAPHVSDGDGDKGTGDRGRACRLVSAPLRLVLVSPGAPALTTVAVGMSVQASMCSPTRSGGVSMDYSVSVLVIASTVAHQLGHSLGMGHDGVGRFCECSNLYHDHWLHHGLAHRAHTWLELQQLQPAGPGAQPGAGAGLVPLQRARAPAAGREPPLLGTASWSRARAATAASAWSAPTPAATAAPASWCPERSVPRGTPAAMTASCAVRDICAGSLWGSATCPSSVMGSHLTAHPTPSCRTGSPVLGGGRAATAAPVPPTRGSASSSWGQVRRGQAWGQWPGVGGLGSLLPAAGASPVSSSCMASLNAKGDERGHCGQLANGSYVACAQQDAGCGRLQCRRGGARGGRAEGSCQGTTLPGVEDVSDAAMVLPGTACGPGKVCLQHQCQDVSVLGDQQCRSKCHGHGVCNNHGHCHCEPGWAPPTCDSPGAGGSQDSGPAATLERGGSALPTALLLSALLGLALVLGLCCARRAGLHKHLCQLGKGTSCQYRISQPEPPLAGQGPPQRPRPPQWRQATELQVMHSSKPAVPARPDPPARPLPPDPLTKASQAPPSDRPPPPTRPLPADPVAPGTQVTAARRHPAGQRPPAPPGAGEVVGPPPASRGGRSIPQL